MIFKNNNSGINPLPKRRFTVAFPSGGRGTATAVDEVSQNKLTFVSVLGGGHLAVRLTLAFRAVRTSLPTI